MNRYNGETLTDDTDFALDVLKKAFVRKDHAYEKINSILKFHIKVEYRPLRISYWDISDAMKAYFLELIEVEESYGFTK